MTNFMVYDETGDLIRIVGRREEAIYMVALRLGWTFKRNHTKKPSGYREAVSLGDALI